ncbi:valine--tRNA ligase [Candidatus Peregrinibacteria bacterium]|jgi:valyl-tRNA synthetase|nr:valine--tRNA ligase [Candidatus Peregrinibacteria bacterium]
MDFEIEKAYEAKKYEDKIYKKWEESGAFTPEVDPSKKSFTISMPPPNATGVLHLGHAVMLALEDIMIRHHRMMGESALWIPGTDHASIATQNKVEQLIAKEGKTKYDLGRADFLKRVHEYVKDSQSTIRNQIRKMGSSCDWTRERYTLDKGLTDAVQEVFIKMYKDGLIYQGDRIVNWCPRCESTLANDEVEYKSLNDKLYWIKYGPFTLATTRPETKLGDTAVAVHPSDKRYKDMVGKKYMIPGVLGEFEVEVIADHTVDPEFGSGAVKVTPAHSFADFEMAQRNNIPAKSIIDEKGCMMDNCGKYAGMKTHECRKAIVDDMDKMGLIEKIEDYEHNLSICYRCETPVEPLISKQWFINVDKKVINHKGKKVSLKERSIQVIKEKEIEILPSKFNKTYFNWMENLHDWCISRQIWFGHRIPIFYCQECGEVITGKEKPEECTKCKSSKLKQDPDTLDTWFSSGLWTFSTLGWPEKTKELEYFHPTGVMETGYDILFFWVARMILMTTYVLGEIPFETVYLHGLIRDRNGDKMSKSKPETCIDPLEMIEKYGTDAVRLSLVIGSTPGNDMRLYEEKIAGYRNFVNKIWNAARFALMNVEKEDLEKEFEPGMVKSLADKWVLTELQKLIKEVDADMEKHHFSEAGTKIYDFIWSQYCDWYLEISKGEHKNPAVLIHVLRTTLKLLHPFVPYVTEKLWEYVGGEKLLISEKWPEYQKELVYTKEAGTMELIHEVISQIRSVRAELKVEPGKKIHAIIYAGKHTEDLEGKREAIMLLGRLEQLDIEEKGPKVDGAKAIFVKDTEIYLPLKDMLDTEKEAKRLKAEIENKEKFAKSLEGKLSNKGYLQNAAKEVIEKDKARLEDEKTNLQKLKSELEQL